MVVSTPEHPGWIEISIHIDPIAHEALSAFLFDLGCTGIITEAMQDHALKAYLPFHKNLEDVRKRIECFVQDLKRIFRELHDCKLSFNKIENQDWNCEWKRFFRSDRVTPGLTVSPIWEPAPSSANREVITIDPGPAFGTGQHPTTRMCLEAMEKIHLSGSWNMLDVGTGSGILAIYGVKLGAVNVNAIDIDPEAVRWAKRNIELNGLSGAIELSTGPLEQIEGDFSLIAANLILEEILKVFSLLSRSLKPGGWLILSGILTEQVKTIGRVLRAYPFQRPMVMNQDEWACMVLRKESDI
jgi:ribosomal protein L11 methyltransferase